MEAEKDASREGAKHAKFGKLFLSLRSWRLGGINSVEVALFNILKARIESGVRDSTLVGKTRERLRFEFLELGQEKLATFYFATVLKSYEISLAGST